MCVVAARVATKAVRLTSRQLPFAGIVGSTHWTMAGVGEAAAGHRFSGRRKEVPAVLRDCVDESGAPYDPASVPTEAKRRRVGEDTPTGGDNGAGTGLSTVAASRMGAGSGIGHLPSTSPLRAGRTPRRRGSATRSGAGSVGGTPEKDKGKGGTGADSALGDMYVVPVDAATGKLLAEDAEAGLGVEWALPNDTEEEADEEATARALALGEEGERGRGSSSSAPTGSYYEQLKATAAAMGLDLDIDYEQFMKLKRVDHKTLSKYRTWWALFMVAPQKVVGRQGTRWRLLTPTHSFTHGRGSTTCPVTP